MICLQRTPRSILIAALLLPIVACSGDSKETGGGGADGADGGAADGADGGTDSGLADGGGDGADPDSDGDGITDSNDCDPDDPTVYPGADEVPYDGIDQDCFRGDLNDLDVDGYPGAEAGGPDCDDTDPAINPGVEDLGDGIDNDCDTEIDEDVRAASADWPVLIAGRGVSALGGPLVVVDGDPRVAVRADGRATADTGPELGVECDDSTANWGVLHLNSSREVVAAALLRGTAELEITDLAASSGGDTFAVGWMEGTVHFDPEGVRTFRESAGGQDAMFARFDATGDPIYALSMGGTDDERISAALASTDDLFVAGGFGSNMMVNPGAPPEDAEFINAPNPKSGFLARYDAEGLLRWASVLPAGASSSVEIADMTFSNSGDLLVVGTFKGTMAASVATLTSAPITATGVSDIFLARISAATGSVTSLAQIGEAGDTLRATSVGALGGLIFIGGAYEGTPFEFPAAVNQDGILLSVGGDGAVYNVRRLSTEGRDEVTGLSVSPVGQLFAVGSYGGVLDLGGGFSVDPFGTEDCFFASFDSSLVGAAGYRVGGAEAEDRCRGLALSSDAAYFSGTAGGDMECSLTGGSDVRTLYGTSDAFVHRFGL
jgi:hypothetical protein